MRLASYVLLVVLISFVSAAFIPAAATPKPYEHFALTIASDLMHLETIMGSERGSEIQKTAGTPTATYSSENDISLLSTTPTVPITSTPDLPCCIQATQSPARTQSPNKTHKTPLSKLEQLGAASVDWIAPLVIIAVSAVILRHLRRLKNDSGMIAGAGAAGGIFILIRGDKQAPLPLLITVGLVYIAFHYGYCATIATSLGYGDGFTAITVMAAIVALVALAQFPSSFHSWSESSGMSGFWMVFPLHVGAVFVSALLVRVLRAYMNVRIEPEPLLPIRHPQPGLVQSQHTSQDPMQGSVTID